MIITVEHGSSGLDRIQYPANLTPEELASRIPLPDQEVIQAYLLMRFGGTILNLSPEVQANLYQTDVSGAYNQPPQFEPVQVNWDILLGTE